MKKSRLFIMIAVFLVLVPTFSVLAQSDDNPGWVQPGGYWDTSVAAAVNYLGLSWTNNLTYRIPLIRNPGMLWKSTKIEVGLQDQLTPSFHRISAFLQIEPIAVFDIKVLAGYDIEWAALTGGMYRVQDPSTITNWGASYDDVIVPATRYTGHGFRLKVMPTAKVAFGPVAALYTFTLGYHAYNDETGTGYYYDPETASIQKVNDFYLVHDGKLLFQFYDFRVGADFIVTSVPSWGYSNIKLAGLLVYTPSWKVLPETVSPYAIVMMGSFLNDQYLAGKFSFAAVVGTTVKVF